MIGLALSGGGVKGSYQIGAYMAFKECGIKFDGITGTSIGAFNGAIIAAGLENELLSFWQNIDIGKLLNYNDKYLKKLKSKEEDLELLLLKIDNFISIINNKGISIEGLQRILVDFDVEEKLRKSNIEYGLSTYRMKDGKALDLFLEDIPKGSLNNYIIASCYLPIFKKEKLVDDSYFFDGGIHNYCPIDMLINKDYEKVYAIDLKAIGFKRPIQAKEKVITISPSRKISSMLTVDQEKIKDNIKLGYYDTIKVLKQYDGFKYIFKKNSKLYYKYITRKINKSTLNLASLYYKTNDKKQIVIKAIEQLMKKDNETYYSIYKIRKQIKKYQKYEGNNVALKVIKELK